MPVAAYRQKTHVGNEFCPYGRRFGNYRISFHLLRENGGRRVGRPVSRRSRQTFWNAVPEVVLKLPVEMEALFRRQGPVASY